MLEISFAGRWQFRMALDPDPNDEPRGVSGPTVALPGEPDFDTFMYLQDHVCPRYPFDWGNGVFVNGVTVVDDTNPALRTPLGAHPLIGAAVNLLESPTYAERGFVVLYQKMPIDPFVLQIKGGGVELYVKDLWDPQYPEWDVNEVATNHPELLERRSVTVQPQSALVAATTGIVDYVAYRLARLEQLVARRAVLEPVKDAEEIAGLDMRIRMLEKDKDSGADEGLVGLALESHQFLGLCGFYQFLIQGTPRVTNQAGPALGGQIGVSQPWFVDFWVGGFDVDTLTGWMSGVLRVPFHPGPPVALS
ncbi:MAG: hypothetical protein ACRD0Z_06905 [Acidimicrobiales bacterium]